MDHEAIQNMNDKLQFSKKNVFIYIPKQSDLDISRILEGGIINQSYNLLKNLIANKFHSAMVGWNLT